MKKLCFIARAILRGAIFLSPGVITFLYIRHNYPLLVNIMCALGAEYTALLLIAFWVSLAQAVRNYRKK